MDISSSARHAVPQARGLRGIMQRHPLLCYFLLAYGFSWLGWLPYVLSQDGLGLLPFSPGQLASLPGAYLGPLLSGLLMTGITEGKPGVGRLLRRLILWRVGWQWYLLAIAGIPVITVIGFLALPGTQATINLIFPQIIMVFPLLLIMEILTSGLAEEPGWRGFALPRLQQQLGPLLGSILLGVLWQCWHLPLYLTSWGNGAGWPQIGVDILGNVAITIVITWAFNHTRGSLLIAILMHATLDAFGVTAATSLFSLDWVQKYGDLALLIGFGLVALVLVVVTRGRLGYQQVVSPSNTLSASNVSQS